MRVLHVIPSLSVKEGGPSFAATAMAEALAVEGVQVTIATTRGVRNAPVIGDQLSVIGEETRQEDASTERRGYSESAAASDRGYRVVSFRREFEPYKISFGLTRWLRANVKQFDLVHIHALFSFSSTVAARIARKNNVPYIVRPLGVLNPWGMQHRRWLPKLISFRLVELPILLHSAAIHYTSGAERNEAARLNHKLAGHESVVIPLPIAQPETGGRTKRGDAEVFRSRYPELKKHRVILFLSRIHPMKGLELLIDAFAMVRETNEDVALVIAGDGEESYVRALRERARNEGPVVSLRPSFRRGAYSAERAVYAPVGSPWSNSPSSDVIWTGHLGGEMKAAALAAADVFVLPSASENFGIAAAESLAAGVPTIVSEEVALSSDIRSYDAGVVVKRDVQQLAGAIGDLLSNRERAAGLAANGRRLAQERYSPEAVGKALHQLYEHVISKR